MYRVTALLQYESVIEHVIEVYKMKIHTQIIKYLICLF